ncbi:helix-turn-helix domain-containing protein [Streptomyces sp. NBC_00289]|uniref:AraC-like ligand-binding domain-containing protein n=1 Tax=Streptomyces sp. NBC_00289 TaxID=2975703 RepID=UPI0032525F75
MLEKVFDSQDLPVSKRVAAWREITASALIPNEFGIDHPTEFRASLQAADLGGVQVTALTCTSMRSQGTPQEIRQSDPEMYAVGHILRGQRVTFQERGGSALGAGDLVVYSTCRPYQVVMEVQPGTAASVMARIPRAMVPLPSNRVERLLAAPMSGREGLGGLLAGFLTHLTSDTSPCRPADGHRLGGVLADLVTAWLAHHIDAAGQVPAVAGQHTQFLEIQDFMRRKLGDAELSPATVAAAHHISLRTLHRLFHMHAHGATVTAYIRRQRLSRARRDLADPHLATRPVHAIAACWGFPRPADFTRAFRTAYGTTPTEYRREFLHGQPGTLR